MLHRIGGSIGPLLKINAHTCTATRARFARLCVQINLNDPLITTIQIGRAKQAVVYEGIDTLCFECGRVGHSRNSCSTAEQGEGTARENQDEEGNSNRGRKQASDKPTREAQPEGTESKFGPWLVVQKTRNKHRGMNQSKEEGRREEGQRGMGSRLGQKGKDSLQRKSVDSAFTFVARASVAEGDSSTSHGLRREMRTSKGNGRRPIGPSLILNKTGKEDSAKSHGLGKDLRGKGIRPVGPQTDVSRVRERDKGSDLQEFVGLGQRKSKETRVTQA